MTNTDKQDLAQELKDLAKKMTDLAKGLHDTHEEKPRAIEIDPQAWKKLSVEVPPDYQKITRILEWFHPADKAEGIQAGAQVTLYGTKIGIVQEIIPEAQAQKGKVLVVAQLLAEAWGIDGDGKLGHTHSTDL